MPATIAVYKTVLRRHADGDRERHRERQRDDADDDPGEHVRAQSGAIVPLSERLFHRGRHRQRNRTGIRAGNTERMNCRLDKECAAVSARRVRPFHA